MVIELSKLTKVFSQITHLFISPRNLASSSQPPYATMISQKHPNSFVLLIHYYSFVHTFNIPLQLRSSYMGIAMMAVMHLYFHFTQPLFIQSLMGFKGLYDAKLVSIHLLGKPATGDLKRPFKAASMFGGKVFFSFFHISFIFCIYGPLQ